MSVSVVWGNACCSLAMQLIHSAGETMSMLSAIFLLSREVDRVS